MHRKGGSISLTISPIFHSRAKGSGVAESGPVCKYQVGCLPAGQAAEIHDVNPARRSDWRIYREVGGIVHRLSGHFESVDEALKWLQTGAAAGG